MTRGKAPLGRSGSRSLLPAVIALGFVLGQFCALIHATHHELTRQPTQPACAICVIAHAASVRPAMPPLPTATPAREWNPTVAESRRENLQPITLPPGRAPPTFLA